MNRWCLMRYASALTAIAFILAAGPGWAGTSGFSCANTETRLLTFLLDEGPPLAVKFVDSDANYPAVRQTDIVSDTLFNSYFWCAKSDDSVRALSVSFHLLDIALPSKAEKAQAILADAVCTMAEAEMTDCDAVVELTMKAVEKGGTAHLGINKDWDLWVKNRDGVLNYEFQAVVDDVYPRKELHLMMH